MGIAWIEVTIGFQTEGNILANITIKVAVNLFWNVSPQATWIELLPDDHATSDMPYFIMKPQSTTQSTPDAGLEDAAPLAHSFPLKSTFLKLPWTTLVPIQPSISFNNCRLFVNPLNKGQSFNVLSWSTAHIVTPIWLILQRNICIFILSLLVTNQPRILLTYNLLLFRHVYLFADHFLSLYIIYLIYQQGCYYSYILQTTICLKVLTVPCYNQYCTVYL